MPAASAFAVTVEGSTHIIASGGVSVDGASVTLTLATPVTGGQTVTVGYTQPQADPLRDADNAMHPAPDFAGETVTNNTASIVSVRIVSTPSIDADDPSDGTPETYGVGETIAVDVTFGEAVAIVSNDPNQNADPDKVRLRLDLGEDGAAGTVRVLKNPTRPDHRTLRFEYTVEGDEDNKACNDATTTADCDPDGVWVQTGTNGEVVFLAGGPTRIRTTAGDVNVSRTYAGLGTAGDPNHNVDGSRTAAATVLDFESAAANEKNLSVTFNTALRAAGTKNPPGSVFTVTAVDKATPPNTRTIAGTAAPVKIAGKTVTAVLSAAVAHKETETLTLAYTAPSVNALGDHSDTALGNFSGKTVQNNTGDPPPRLVAGKMEFRGFSRGTLVTLYFSEALHADSKNVAPHLFFRYLGDAIRNAQVDGKTLTVESDHWLDASMTDAWVTIADTSHIRDLAGNPMEALEGRFPVVNTETQEPGAPAPAASDPAVVDGDTLTFRFDQRLDPSQVPATSAFPVSGGAEATTVTAVAVRDASVVLTLDRTVAGAETGIKVTYTKPAADALPKLRNLWGEAAETTDAPLAVRNAGDAKPPRLVSGTINRTNVTLVFSETLDVSRRPTAAHFALKGTNTVLSPVADIAVRERSITMTAAAAATATETVTVTVPDTTNIRDLAGNAARSVGGTGVVLTNTRGADPGAPALADTNPAVVYANVVTLSFDKALDPLSVPPAAAWTVSGAVPEAIVDSVEIQGKRAVLRLRGEVVGGWTKLKVSYDPRVAPAIRNLWGTPAAGFDDQAVKAVRADEVAPEFQRAEVAGAELKLFFDEALDAAGTPPGSAFRVRAAASDDIGRDIAGTGTAAVEGNEVTVTLAGAVAEDELLEVWYDARATPALRDPVGHGLVVGAGCWDKSGKACWDAWPAANVDIVAPVLVSGTAGDSAIVLHFSEPLDEEGDQPDHADFIWSGGAGLGTNTGTTVDGNAIRITISGTVDATETVSVNFHTTNKIRDLAGNKLQPLAAPFELTNVKATGPGAPVWAATDPAVVDGATLTLTFNVELDPTSVPGSAGLENVFPLLPAWQSAAADSMEVDGTKAVLTLVSPVRPCAGMTSDGSVKVSYIKPASNALRNLWGEEVAAFDEQDVQNLREDRCTLTAPKASMEGGTSGQSKRAMLRFERPLDTTKALSADAFEAAAIGAGAAPIEVAGASFTAAGTGVALALDRAVGRTDTVTVRYRQAGGTGGLWDTAGKEIAPFSVEAASDGVAAVVSAVELSSAPATGDTYGLGEALRVTLGFDQAVAVDTSGGTPRLKLDMDPAHWGDKWALYDSGGGTATLVFAYTVTEPNKSTQGIAVLGDSLELNGGMIRSVATQAQANLRHAGLAHDAAHKVDWTLEANTPATGAPAIEGDAQVGEMLTASSGDIDDADGLDGASFAWQWIRVDGGAEADIAGATRTRYTLTDADEGKTIRVRATFTDDAGNAESAVSAVTDTVAPRLPLTAAFHGAPAEHDGARRFSLELRFSENFPGRLDYRILRDHALSATGGRVVAASRAAQNQNQRWIVEVRPASTADVTVTLAATTDCSAAAAICTPDGRPLFNSPSVTVAGPPNSPATGAPTIEGTVRVGETLVASTAAITDTDGLDNATFAFQWIRVADGGAQADIAGAAGSTYLLADADEGNTIRVRASFTDDAGNAETLTSAPTVPVEPRPEPPRITGVAVVSDPGPDDIYELQDRILVQLTFDEAVTVAGAPLLTIDMDPAHWGAKQMTYSQGSGTDALSFAYTVVWPNESTQGIAVLADTLALNGAAIRSAATNVDAVLAHTGLGHDPAHKVDWRPVLSVADAEAREAAGAAVEFTVTLSRTAQHAVTVHYATSDGTATAGEDYTATVGTLTFPPGVTTRTVAVSLIDDAIDEGRETFTLTLSNPDGARIGDGEATGTIINSDAMPKAWTARFGRTVAVHVVDAVEARLEAAPAPFVQLGGHRLGGAAHVQETVRRLAPEHSLWEEEAPADPAHQNLTFSDLLLGSAFHLVSNEDSPSGPRLSAWGRVANSGFDAREDELSLNGTVTTATLGVDGAWKRWLSGLLMAYSEGDGSFTHDGLPGGDVSSSLTSLHPYVAYTLNDRVRLWGLVGYGGGSLHLRLEDGRAMDTDLALTMGALGVRGSLLRPAHPSGLDLALRSDVMWMRMDSARADNLAPTQADVSRLRLLLQGSRTLALAGGSFTPSLEVGLRRDGGDAETGTGVEIGGSLRYSSTWGLSIEASARALLAHESQGYREWGAGGALRFDPGRQGKGLTASIVPTWGTAAGGAESLWGHADAGAMAPAQGGPAVDAAGRLQAELGYGLATLHGRGLLTPYARIALVESADRAWHLGTRLALAGSLNLSLEAGRKERRGQAAANELALRAALGF